MAPLPEAEGRSGGSKTAGLSGGLPPKWCNFGSILEVQLKSAKSMPFKPPWGYYLEDAAMSLEACAGSAAAAAGGAGAGGAGADEGAGRRQPPRPISAAMRRASVAGPRCGSAGGRRGSVRGQLGAAARSNAPSGPAARPPSAPAKQRAPADPQVRFAMLFEALLRGGGPIDQVLACIFWLTLGVLFGRAPPPILEALRGQLCSQWHLVALATYQMPPDTKDRILAALPLVFAQASYRMLCDGFDQDRKVLLAQADALVLKIGKLAHFEVTGFQPHVDTLVKARRRLFLEHVVRNPHLDRREVQRGTERLEHLENRTQTRPALAFGLNSEDVMPLDNTLCEHVLHGRGAPSPTASGATAEGDLVERCFAFMEEGEALLDRQLSQLDAIASAPWREADSNGSDDGTDQSATPVSCGSASPKTFRASGSEGEATDFDPGANLRSRSASIAMAAEAAEKRRRKRHEVLQRMITVDPLPREMCSKTINTAWVSPVTMSLSPDLVDRREALRKPMNESKTLKMESNPVVRPRSLSTPALRSLQASEETSRSRAHDARSTSHASAKEDASATGSRGRRSGSKKREDERTVDGHAGHTSSGVFASTGHSREGYRSHQTLPRERREAGETFVLAPPKCLPNDQILQRLEAQAKAFRQNTFEEYKKEYDLLTGLKKHRIDGKRLRDEEAATCRKMHDLLGDEPKRMIPLSTLNKLR
eukprot:TRINITY_DN16279_c0_g1_i1.p1 TRINITY_DN16279_c0_g1~~TRINITY_DN16279_c0_g1_i1.p1  ORF type:complete len:707 (-),score=159.13 TRINITY_DN16279_c0_g1_i1:28-2148(-)